MAETQAESSTADVFNGGTPTLAEYEKYRQEGEIPERFKSEEADSTTADTPEETVEPEAEAETEPESEPDETQEPKPSSAAEKRIKQLLAKNKDLERRLQATPAPQPQAQAANRTKPTPDGKGPDGKPYATYEDYVEDLSDWKVEQRLDTEKRQQTEARGREAIQKKLDESRTRYKDADEVIFPTAEALQKSRIPAVVTQVIGDSDLFTDICYVLGEDPAELSKFIALAKSNPREALAKVFEYERGIREELSGSAPAPRKTSAPKPPSTVRGSSSRAFDASDESLSAEEWARKRTTQLNLRRKS